MARLPAKGQGNKLDESALWEYALRSLAARAHSVAELRRKLRRRAVSHRAADNIITKLEGYGYVDDRRYAETFAAARLDNQGFGKIRILRDLRKKGVPRAVAEQAVSRVFEDIDEAELADAFLKRKYRKVSLAALLTEPRNLASAYRRLRYAGFAPGIAIEALKRYSGRAEELEGLEEEPGGKP